MEGGVPEPARQVEIEIVGCPVCHDTNAAMRGHRVYPCAHTVCSACAAQLPEPTQCPTCRQTCQASEIQDHQPLAMLSMAHHCSRCRARWDSDAHTPTLLRPCMHQVCRSCATADACPVCQHRVDARVDDHAFMAALTHGVLAPPPWELLRDHSRSGVESAQDSLVAFEGALMALCGYIRDNPQVLEWNWTTAPGRVALWSEEQRASYNALMALAMAVGRLMPIQTEAGQDGFLTSYDIKVAVLGASTLGVLVEQEIHRAYSMQKARRLFSPALQSSMARLPWVSRTVRDML